MSGPDANGWRTIADAPSDGRTILVAYAPATGRPVETREADGIYWRHAQAGFTPTHWQDLPAPPEAA